MDINKDAIFTDLHIHSKYSRATSSNLSFENLVKWAKIKGLHLLGTGDFTHPIWFEEIKNLEDRGNGFYYFSGFPFIITGEISLMYTQEKGRRIHLVILVPSLEIAEEINSYLDTKGRRDYDGRPIFNISAEEFTRDMMEISKYIEIIPAHCLLPDSLIHLENSVKRIKEIKPGDKVLTHKGNFKLVKDVLMRHYGGKVYKIIPWYFREGLSTTPEHPFYIIKSYKKCPSIKGLCKPLCSQVKKGCARKYFENYSAEWIMAKDVEVGDFLVYPRIKDEKDISEIDLSRYIKDYREIDKEFIVSKDARNHTGKIKRFIKIDEKFCRLLGYFLSEGYLIKNSAIAFSFHSKEKEYISEVLSIIQNSFGFKVTNIDSRRENQSDLIFSSKLLNEFFRHFYFGKEKRANNKYLPKEFINLHKRKLVEIFRGWWRGDTGYTISRQLTNQMKIICLSLGIIPSISIDSARSHKGRGKHFILDREIIAKNDLIIFSNLSFFEEDYGMLKENCFKKFINKRKMKHGWIDENYAYLPVRKIDVNNYRGDVYNLEVEGDNSYVSEFACVHNCWTPWFGLFGSKTGFDSLKEAFGSQLESIHAIETGMSSDAEMNWKISELNNKAIVSFSDSHSFWPFRLGREATIFHKADSYAEIIKQIRENSFVGTIETDPAYGKYHYDGHRLCNFSCSPERTKELKGICPVCGKPLTIGVEYRVGELGNQSIDKNPNKKLFYKLLPLHELIAFNYNTSMTSKKVWDVYNFLIGKFGNEFNILLNVSEGELTREKVDAGLIILILKNREGRIRVKPGFDGEYGKVEFEEKQRKLF